MAEIRTVLTDANNRDSRGTLWLRVTAGRSSANVSQGRIGRLWGGNTGRSILRACALRTPCRFVFDKHRLLRSGIFSLLRRQGFSLSPERYLRRPLLLPVQILLMRNGTAIHHGRSLPRPLSVVNNNTTSHKVSRHRQINQQFNQQFIRQWHYHRQLNLVSNIGLAAPVMRGIVALHLLQGQRDLLRTAGHAQTAGSLLVSRDGRFSADEVLSAADGFTGIIGSVTRTLYKYNSVARAGLPFTRPHASLSADFGITDHDAPRITLDAYASARRNLECVPARPAFPESNPAFRLHAARLKAPLLRIVRLGISACSPAIAAGARGRARRWRADATHYVHDHQSLLSSIPELSPLSNSSVSRPRSSSAAKRPLRLPAGVARLVSSRNKDAYSGRRSGFILAARDSAGLAGLVVSMRERMSCPGVLHDIVTNETLPGSLLGRRRSVASTGHGRLMQQQRMRTQHAIVELSRGREQQQQEFRRRDERVFNELRQQLQSLQRNSSNEQAALLKAMQSLERVLTQTLKRTPVPAIRPLSFMGNR